MGIKTSEQFSALRAELAGYADLPIRSEDHEHAAAAFSRCMSRGVQSNLVEMLICVIGLEHDLSNYTLDQDFASYSKILLIKMHKSRTS